MPLAAGERLGPYEILAPIGAGGMGEVYRARDTKLDREVAIKVLPVALAQDPERLARFEREAKVLASLNHPNIAQIYGFEDRALVMELVDGETLHGPLSLEIALNYAHQIANALEAAHEKNIIHRDLKAANIMITPSGVVKVLDFGLAAVAQASDPSNPANSPTLTISPTRAGMILGTAAYMSPEQARGKAVDKRADIWAFGVVLYEMLTGEQLFQGETVSDTLAQVLTKEPDWEQVPAKVRRLLKKCLEKDPKKRLRDIGDAWELMEVVEPPTTAPSRSRLSWVVAAIMAIAAAAGWAIAYRATRPAELKPLVRLDVDLGSDVSLGSLRGADAVISRDGTRLVYVSRNRLFTRRLDQSKATELAGTEGADTPFLSPDGQWVAFFAGGKLKKTSLEGGGAISLCDATGGVGGSWGEDGNIVAALTATDPLSRIPSAGGAPTPVTEFTQGEITHRWPQVLPGAKAVLFTAHAGTSAFNMASIEAVALSDRRNKVLVRGGTFGRYLPSGHLVYVSGGTLFAVPLDLEKLELRGTPTPLLEQVNYSQANGSAQFDFSGTGTLVYQSGGAGSGLVILQWLDGTGQAQPLLATPGYYQRPRLSPDGQRLAMDVTQGSKTDIWVYEWPRDTMTRLTFDGGDDVPVWNPDGRYVAFQRLEGIFWTRSDGTGKIEPLIQGRNQPVPWSFSPDGKRLAFFEANAASTNGLWTLPLEPGGTGLRAGKPEAFLQTRFFGLHPYFSPDGRWLAYSSNESGTLQIYVISFPDKNRKWQISSGGGVYPVWPRNGSELFFRTLDNRIMVASYTVKGDSFVAEKPRVWSEKMLGGAAFAGNPNYDVAPDGKRIAALMPVEGPEARQAQNHVIFLENFFDELRRRAPVGK